MHVAKICESPRGRGLRRREATRIHSRFQRTSASIVTLLESSRLEIGQDWEEAVSCRWMPQ